MDEVKTGILQAAGAQYTYYPISQVEGFAALPYSLRVVLENILRNASGAEAAHEAARRLVGAATAGQAGEEISFSPARVLFQDFTGVPVFVDFAVMREACEVLGGDPGLINPQVPCDLVIDHSVIADVAGSADALERNMALEFDRNRERYDFLKWSQASFSNVGIVPPGQGICHQVNVESIAPVVMTRDETAYFDTVVGTDSHTPTVNGLGVLGWGVGGIEAEAASLGQPIPLLVPRVVGVRLSGRLSAGVSAMDVALTFAEMLRSEGVVGCFVECFGEGLSSLSATARACISNMTPEYGSTCTLFPIDERTLDYLATTGRAPGQVALVEAYAKAQGLWAGTGAEAGERVYSKVIELDLGNVKRSIAGPSRPHDRFDFSGAPAHVRGIFEERGLVGGANAPAEVGGVNAPVEGGGDSAPAEVGSDSVRVEVGGVSALLGHGAVAIAAITSCTTATDPAMMVAAGLLARNAADRGLESAPWVKTILAPGSRATELLLERAGLLEGLRRIGFHTCGFGCMSCIGNSGPLSDAMHDAAGQIELAAALSGNRNFEGRISPDVAQNYLMPPALVVAYALAGFMDWDFDEEPVGTTPDDEEVFLRDLWPSDEEVASVLSRVVDKGLYEQGAATLFQGGPAWDALGREPSSTFSWDEASTYVRRAPYFEGMPAEAEELPGIEGARALAYLGDFITTDHISPAGSIAADSAAASYLRERGVADADFNTYGARRGNHEVMARGTFANVKLKNKLAEGRAGGWTRDFLDGEVKLLFDAAEHYARAGVPLVVLAGKMYGSGSSRDWAAKGPALLGVRAVFAESYERIHRSNLVGMGVLPLQLAEGQSAESLGLDGTERFDIPQPDFAGPWPQQARVRATRVDGSQVFFEATVRIDTPTEAAYYQNGGILPFVLRTLASR